MFHCFKNYKWEENTDIDIPHEAVESCLFVVSIFEWSHFLKQNLSAIDANMSQVNGMEM